MRPTKLNQRLTALVMPFALVAVGADAWAADLTARNVAASVYKATVETPVDFSGKDLSNLDLAGLDFKHARLTNVNLYGADLSTANLAAVDLSGAKLDRATIMRTDFTGANLQGATILKPNVFSDMTFNHADAPNFSGANLRGARIAARLDGANFRGADLTGAVVGPADTAVEAGMAPSSRMMKTDFSDATLDGAVLQNLDLTFARFVGAKLSGAKLTGLDLTNADMAGADLTGADVSGSNFKGANLAGVKGLETIKGRDSASNLEKPQQ